MFEESPIVLCELLAREDAFEEISVHRLFRGVFPACYDYYLKGIEKLPPASSKYCRMTWSRSLACELRLAAMNLNALRRQYLVIYSFVLRRRLNFPTNILNARRSVEFPCDIFLPYSYRVSSLRCEWSTKNWIMVLNELQMT